MSRCDPLGCPLNVVVAHPQFLQPALPRRAAALDYSQYDETSVPGGAPPLGPSSSVTHLAYDDRPAQGRGVYNASAEIAAGGLSGGGAPPRQQEDGVNLPDGWPSDFPPPEPLSGARCDNEHAAYRAQ